MNNAGNPKAVASKRLGAISDHLGTRTYVENDHRNRLDESMNEGVLIVRAGVAGSYLYRLLANKGMRVTICDTDFGRAKCGVHPCGFAVSSEFRDLTKQAGLDPKDYVTQ
jgi:hypothetical protein